MLPTPLDIADEVIGRLGAGAEASVRVGRGVTALTRFANSTIHQNVAEDEWSVRLHAVIDGRPSAGTTNRTDGAALGALVDRVLASARLRPVDPAWPGLAPRQPVPDVEHHDPGTEAATPAQRAEVVKAFIDAGEGFEAAGYCATSSSTVAFVNSAGHRVERRASSAQIDGIHRAPGDEGWSDGGASQTSVRLSDLDGAAAGGRAAAKARAGLTIIDVAPESQPVVLEPRCVADIMQFLGMAGFNAKPWLDQTSFVHLGELQFDPWVSLRDDVTDADGIGLPFDLEGTAKRGLDLVVDGVTSAVVHNRRTARRAGVESTGHAMGSAAFGAYPSNMILGPGEATPEGLLAAMADGLLVSDFWYTRILDPKTQVVTGLTRNGLFVVRGGEVCGAARNLRFTQSYVGALGPGRVLGIGNDVEAVGGMRLPSVRLAAWNFTGGAKG